MPTAVATPRSRSKRAAKSTPDSPHELRIRKVREAAGKAGCEALLVTNRSDIRYLTGFRGDDSFALLTPDRIVVLSDFRFQEELEAVKPLAQVVIRTGLIMDALKAVAAEHAPAPMVIGVQAEHASVEQRASIAKAVGAKRLRDTSGLLRAVRAIKDEHEIKAIRRAVKIQEEALLATLETIESGQTESHICARLEFEMKIRGADQAAFDPIVASGANGSLPHAVPGKAKVAAGRPLLIDWGARVDGYCSDMTRTFSFGKWPAKMAEIYGVVLAAQQAAVKAIGPGKSAKEIDSIARAVITDAGYGPQFGHSLGHGIGLDVHENPRLSQQSTDTLAAGMVVTVEPGIYIPGLGGVRIEDDVLVTDTGAKNLCTLPKTIEWATR